MYQSRWGFPSGITNSQVPGVDGVAGVRRMVIWPSWTAVWWNWQSRIRLSRSVGPPSAQWMRWWAFRWWVWWQPVNWQRAVVADDQGAAEGAGDEAAGAAEGEDAAVAVEDRAEEVGVAGELAGGVGFDPADALEVAGRIRGVADVPAGTSVRLVATFPRERFLGAGELVGVDLDDDEGPVFAGAVVGGGVE